MKEPSRFYSSLGLLIILNLIIKPLWIFGIDRQVQNAVGTEAYGIYFSLFGFSVVFSFLLDWGITAFFNRQLAAKNEDFVNLYGKFLSIKLLFAILYIIVVCMLAWLSGMKRWDIIAGVIAVQVLTSFFIFFRSIVIAQQWFSTDAWLSILDKSLMIALFGGLIYFPLEFGSITINKFLIIQIICSSLALL